MGGVGSRSRRGGGRPNWGGTPNSKTMVAPSPDANPNSNPHPYPNPYPNQVTQLVTPSPDLTLTLTLAPDS